MVTKKFRRFEDIAEGEKAVLKKTIKACDIDAFVDLSGDNNILHIDDEFARETGFSSRAAHGMLTSAYISTLLGTILPGPGTLWLSQQIEFVRPVYVNDEITVMGEVVKKSLGTRTITLSTRVTNQRGDLVIDGTALVRTLEQREVRHLKTKESQVALVTGGSRGIGAATAKMLAANGFSVIVNYLQNQKAGEAVVADIEKKGGRALTIQADVRDLTSVQMLVEKAYQSYGSIDLLVNGAIGDLPSKSFAEVSWDEIQTLINVQLKGTYNCCHEVLPHMEKEGGGSIINIISTYALAIPPKKMLPYVTVKTALMGFSKSLAVEYAPKGIRINMISPSPTDTDLLRDIPPRVKQVMAAQNPMKRLAQPDDCARTILFLASEASDFISGANIIVSGGQVML